MHAVSLIWMVCVWIRSCSKIRSSGGVVTLTLRLDFQKIALCVPMSVTVYCVYPGMLRCPFISDRRSIWAPFFVAWLANSLVLSLLRDWAFHCRMVRLSFCS